MANVNILREQRMEMTNTFAAIRKKISDAQVSIRDLDFKSQEYEEQKVEAEERYELARGRCIKLRDQIADKERDLFDVENQIPLAKSRMYELESLYGENKHFEKTLARTRKEVTELETRRETIRQLVKEKNEQCWMAKQKMHKLEVRIEDVNRTIDIHMRRIIVAQDRIAAANVQSTTISKNYTEPSKNDMEGRYMEKLRMLNEAKERRKEWEEKALILSGRVEEMEKDVRMYHDKLREMFRGQRELASSKLL